MSNSQGPCSVRGKTISFVDVAGSGIHPLGSPGDPMINLYRPRLEKRAFTTIGNEKSRDYSCSTAQRFIPSELVAT